MTVSSVKNLNGETFSAVQDASLTDIVSSNSANWNEISAYQANSANYLQNTDLTISEGKITEISGVPLSAGGGGGGTSYSAGDFIDITNDVISVDEVCDVSAGNGINIFQSANYVTIELGLSAGITDVALVNELPAEPIATVLYLIPET